jgi:hypothetical protein
VNVPPTSMPSTATRAASQKGKRPQLAKPQRRE